VNHHEENRLAADSARAARHASSGWWRAICQICPVKLGTPDRRGGFAVFVSTGAFHCFRCGTSGRLRDWEAREEVEPEAAEVEAMAPPDGFFELLDPSMRRSKSAEAPRGYLLGRGVGPELWAAARIGACMSGKHFGRVIVPILADDQETWLGWVGRAWVPRCELPYRYPAGMGRRGLLYNHAALAVETDVPAIVVEGVMDALAVWPHGVAVLGKPSEPQIIALAAARRPVAVVMDGDAWEEGWVLGLRLRLEGARAGSVKLPPKLDPDQVPLDWLMAEADRCIDTP